MDISPTTIEKYKAILGLETLPLAWTEKEVAQLGVRSIHSLSMNMPLASWIYTGFQDN